MKPLLKWAGGKQKLFRQMLPYIPDDINTYYEPFLGGGAIFFNLPHQPKKCILSDTNSELINFYNVVKTDLPKLLLAINQFAITEENFYNIRGWDRNFGFRSNSPVKRAARFLFLNKTCFNGLYRTNQQGEFNSPWGKYKNPTMYKLDDMKRAFHMFNKPKKVDILCQGFDKIRPMYPDDLVYFDPPYYPLNSTSFVGYGPDKFGTSAHTALAEVCVKLDKKGVRFLLSNSYCDFTTDLYHQWDIITINARRNINSNAEGRGAIKEILVKNF
jgi:DNA adenine methylase